MYDRIIFLDIGGVMAPDSHNSYFHPDNIILMKEIVEKAGAKIMVISAMPVGDWPAFFAKHGWEEAPIVLGPEWYELDEWLENHEVSEYLIVDDQYGYDEDARCVVERLREHVVHVDSKIGFSSKDAKNITDRWLMSS